MDTRGIVVEFGADGHIPTELEIFEGGLLGATRGLAEDPFDGRRGGLIALRRRAA